jgi:hypothetical protein
MPSAEEPPAISAMLSSAHDLDVALTEDDMDLVEEFEARWRGYMHDNPGVLPTSGRSKRLAELKSKILKVKMNTTVVEKELKDQLKLYIRSREAIEQDYQKEIQEATAAQKSLEDKIEKELDNAAMADRLESQLIPWEHFLDSVDNSAVPSPRASNENRRTMKPSTRAMALVDPSGNKGDVQLRAYRIDHALLSAQVKMLRKEIECCERKTEGHEMIGKFLTENNIWTLLSKPSSNKSARS